MADDRWQYAQVRNHLLRWRGSTVPGRVPPKAEILTPSGWHRASWCVRRFLSSRWRGRTDADLARRLTVYAGGGTQIDAERCSGVRSRFVACGLRWFLSPPAPMGAPRYLLRERADEAEREFREELGDRASAGVLAEAIAGWERSQERCNGIDSRLQVFLQVAGVTTTLVLANSALLIGNNRAGCIVIAALIVASTALLLAGLYGLLGSMLTFEDIDPDNVLRVINRAGAPDDQSALEQRVAAMFLATRRTSHVATWKLARLKRAMWCLLIGVLGLALASGALVIDAFR